MTKKRRMFDIDLPEAEVPATPETFPAGKISDPPARRGPMATAIAETADTARERAEIEARIRAENDALAHEHVRLQRLGLVLQLVPLDLIEMKKLVRDRRQGPDYELRDLKASLVDLGLSNPIRLEARTDGRFELVQGYRRLTAYKELLAETGDADRWGTIPAAVSLPGEGIDALYRRMVDENLVRKDISFFEMAQLALDYAADPVIALNDPDKAVAVLFRSAGYQKRSYIRAFMPVVERLGKSLRFPEDIPRSLGTTLAKRLEEDEDFGLNLRAALAALDNPSVADELALLRRMAGAGEDDAPPPAAKAPKADKARPARAKAVFQFDRPEGRARCVAEVGKLEIQLDRDFTTVDRRRLEQAVRAMLDALP